MSRFRSIHIVAALATIVASSNAFPQHEGHQHGQRPEQPAPRAQGQRLSDPYPLATCPVSGQLLGSMGEPVVREYDGRAVRFCCEGCIEKFEAAKDEYWAKIDEQIIKDQAPYYPLTICVLSGEPLVENGEDIAINYIHRNRLVRFCCRGCVRDFLKDPEPTLKKLDAAVIQQQRQHYPLQTCVVSSEALGSMGEPYEVVVGNRLVRLCCKSCEKKLRTTPLEYLPTLDEAWKRREMPAPTDKAPQVEHTGHEHQHDSPRGKSDSHDGHEHRGG